MMKNKDSAPHPAPAETGAAAVSGEPHTEAGAGGGLEAPALARLRAEKTTMTREWTEDLIRHGKERRALEAQLAAMTAERDALLGAVIEQAANVIKNFGDGEKNGLDRGLLNEALCCDGYHCGCQGLTLGEYLEHQIRALATQDQRAALEAEVATLKAEKAADVAHADRLADFIEPMADGPPSETCRCLGCQLIAAHDARRKP